MKTSSPFCFEEKTAAGISWSARSPRCGAARQRYGATRRAPHRSQRAFTLIELLVVLAILGLLAGLVGPRLLKHFQGARSQTARLQIEELNAALEIYALDTGSYPKTTQGGLRALLEKPAGVESWNGPYLRKKKLPLDPWKNAYHYRSPGQHGEFDIYTLGADNAPGGKDENRDQHNWD